MKTQNSKPRYRKRLLDKIMSLFPLWADEDGNLNLFSDKDLLFDKDDSSDKNGSIELLLHRLSPVVDRRLFFGHQPDEPVAFVTSLSLHLVNGKLSASVAWSRINDEDFKTEDDNFEIRIGDLHDRDLRVIIDHFTF